MNRILSSALIFAAGAAGGAIVAWKVLEKTINAKYEAMYQEELAAMREGLGAETKKDEKGSSEEGKDEEPEDPERTKYTDILEKNNYVKYSNSKEKEVASMNKPYVITPDEFGEKEDYEVVTLTYYDDGVLTYDEDDDVVYEIEELVGYESLQHFGDYEHDAVHVRNDKLKKDFEILYDNRKYSDLAID